MGVTCADVRNYLRWALSKTSETKSLQVVLNDLIVANVENTSNGFSIIGTSANGTSINYGVLSQSGGLSTSDIQKIFDWLYMRCQQAIVFLNDPEATNEQIAAKIQEAIVSRDRWVIDYSQVRRWE